MVHRTLFVRMTSKSERLQVRYSEWSASGTGAQLRSHRLRSFRCPGTIHAHPICLAFPALTTRPRISSHRLQEVVQDALFAQSHYHRIL